MKTWKWSDLFTDAQGKLDEKRVLGFFIILFGLGYLVFSNNSANFAIIEGFGIGLLGGAMAGDQGK